MSNYCLVVGADCWQAGGIVADWLRSFSSAGGVIILFLYLAVIYLLFGQLGTGEL